MEEALKLHPGVRDAVVVGVPDERFGEAVAAIVERRAGGRGRAIKAHVRGKLAGYKVPRHVMVAESVERAPTGKADYKAVRERVLAWLGTKG